MCASRICLFSDVESEFFDRPSFSPPGKYRSMVEQLAHLSKIFIHAWRSMSFVDRESESNDIASFSPPGQYRKLVEQLTNMSEFGP